MAKFKVTRTITTVQEAFVEANNSSEVDVMLEEDRFVVFGKEEVVESNDEIVDLEDDDPTSSTHVILVINEGIPDEPEVFLSEDAAGTAYENIAIEWGYNSMRRPDETWDQYRERFTEWEESPRCKYDRNDQELHWFKNVQVN